jgi:diguanylate cyclase (GGDEF)-like protein
MLVANVLWWWMDAVQAIMPPFPSLADVGFLLYMPLVFAALLTFPARPQTRHERFKLLLDVAVVVVGGFMVLWYLILGPTVAAGGSDTLAVATSIAYPVCDLVLLWAVTTILLRGPAPACRRPLQILLASLGLHIVGGVYLGYLGLHEGFVGGTWPDLFLLTSLYLLVVAAAEQYRRATPAADTEITRRHSVNRLPYAAVAVSYLLLVLIARGQPLYPLGGLILGAVTITGLVIARQIAALRDNESLIVTDALTGLANRTQLRVALERAMMRRNTGGGALGVLMLDLDGFKEVNDTLGHETGDGLLVAFADVLRRSVRAGDTAARLGGDEFAVVLPGMKDGPKAAGIVAERILTALREPVRIGEHTVTIRTSIGIGIADHTGPNTVAEVLHQADVAMYAAKRRGLHDYAIHGQDTNDAEVARQQLHVDLLHAVEREEFFLVYQPIVDMSTEEIQGVEALIRWRHPDRGIVPPMDFIPACEESGLIEHIGMWVLETASRQVAQWQQIGAAVPLHLHVNLSPRQLGDPQVVDKAAEVLRRTGLDPRRLVVELTESMLLEDPADAVAKLGAFKSLGIRLAIDDFGTGFSSLAHLTRLPVDILKIDRCFVAAMGHDADSAAVAEAIVHLSKALHLDTIAEGIEEGTQAIDLLNLGCRIGQGYHFARPEEAHVLTDLLAAQGVLELKHVS